MTNGNSDGSLGYFAVWAPVGGLSYGSYLGLYSGSVSGYEWNYPAIVSESWQSSSLQIYGSNYTYTSKDFTEYSLPSSVYYLLLKQNHLNKPYNLHILKYHRLKKH